MTSSTPRPDPLARRSPLPSLVSATRLLAAPGVAALLILADGALYTQGLAPAAHLYWLATGLFVLAAATDLLDGWLARRLNAVTPFGAALDHAADKALSTATLAALIYTVLPLGLVIAAGLLIVRDVAVAGLREGASAAGRTVPVGFAGKLKAVVGFLAIAATLALQAVSLTPEAPVAAAQALSLASNAGLWAAAGLGLFSAIGYLFDAARATSPRND